MVLNADHGHVIFKKIMLLEIEATGAIIHVHCFDLYPLPDINSLPKGKILDWFKLKAFADQNLNVVHLNDPKEENIGKTMWE